jgi:predicted AlkP superfamily pyrophosphatase or phosphodiesterase
VWHPYADEFKIACACDILTRFKPDLLMVHTDNIDSYRHNNGLFNEKVDQGIRETSRWLGLLMEAARAAGTIDETVLFLISDHGQMGIKRIISPNVLLADNGFILLDGEGNVKDWEVWCVSNGMSALVFLKEPDNAALREKVGSLFRHWCEEGIYGIGRVITEEDARETERLGGDFSFVLETDGYTTFSDSWRRPLIKNFDSEDYRLGRATHGYLPTKGPQPVLLAKGPGIRQGAMLEDAVIVDEAPTFARLLGLDLGNTDGRCLDEILE